MTLLILFRGDGVDPYLYDATIDPADYSSFFPEGYDEPVYVQAPTRESLELE